MFFHKNCGEPVGVDLSKSLLVIGLVSPTANNLKVTSLYFRSKSNRPFESKFICEYCKKEVETNTIYVRCFICGASIDNLEEAFVPEESNGIVCADHLKLFQEKKKIERYETVASIMKTFFIQGE